MKISPTITVKEWKVLRQEVLERDNYTCAYCGLCGVNSVDHQIPFVYGGLDIASNIVACCKSCNSRKSCRTVEQWRAGKKAIRPKGGYIERFITPNIIYLDKKLVNSLILKATRRRIKLKSISRGMKISVYYFQIWRRLGLPQRISCTKIMASKFVSTYNHLMTDQDKLYKPLTLEDIQYRDMGHENT